MRILLAVRESIVWILKLLFEWQFNIMGPTSKALQLDSNDGR